MREQVSLNEKGVKQLLNFIRDYAVTTGVLVVSTCNCTEIYYVSEKDFSNRNFCMAFPHQTNRGWFLSNTSQLEGLNAVNHLFEAAIGLMPRWWATLQISGLRENAYQWSAG